jgi:deazaflavin-dependent oxidoreductase (nitroreductase family)
MHRERLVLLTTTGAKSGRQHTTPMMFVDDGDRLLVIASNMGAPKVPDWYTNLVVDPMVRVEVGIESYRAAATALSGDEYDRSWASIKERYPFFADHEKQAGRVIPVVALERA